MKHMVMPRKQNTDEISGGQELQAKINAAVECYPSKIVFTYPFGNKAVTFMLKKQQTQSFWAYKHGPATFVCFGNDDFLVVLSLGE